MTISINYYKYFCKIYEETHLPIRHAEVIRGPPFTGMFTSFQAADHVVYISSSLLKHTAWDPVLSPLLDRPGRNRLQYFVSAHRRPEHFLDESYNTIKISLLLQEPYNSITQQKVRSPTLLAATQSL
jgi:hypothetical protein